MFDLVSFFRPVDELGLRRRLWKTAGLLAMFVATFIAMNLFYLPPAKAVTSHDLGLDFLAFYYAGDCAWHGHYQDLYDLEKTKQFDAKVSKAEGLNLDRGFGPFWNPPFVAWMFAPLSTLTFMQARTAWWIFGCCCLSISLVLMYGMIEGPWQTRMLVPVFVLLSNPFFAAFSHGQNTFLSLLLLTLTVKYWREGQAIAAGLVCGLLFYKPQLGAVVAIVLCLSQGRKAMLGVFATGMVLLAITVKTMPHTLPAFLIDMPRNLLLMQTGHNDYIWERHVTFRTFWRILCQGWSKGPDNIGVLIGWWTCEIALLTGLGVVVFRAMGRRPGEWQTDRLISASIVAMPLLMPFYFDYDLLLISLAAVLYVADRQREAAPLVAQTWEDRWLLRVWVILFFAMQAAPPIAPHLRVQPLVPILAVLAVLLIRRALRPPPVALKPVAHPLLVAMAA